MNDHSSDGLLARAQRELEMARLRVRDLEGFVRIYSELLGSAFQMPAPETTAAHVPVEPVVTISAVRPEISLADPELSLSEAAEKVLRHHARVMKAREIAETMLAWNYPYKGTVQELRASVGGVLARKVREGETFTKPEPGVFGLAEWSEQGPSAPASWSRVGDQLAGAGLFAMEAASCPTDDREVA